MLIRVDSNGLHSCFKIKHQKIEYSNYNLYKPLENTQIQKEPTLVPLRIENAQNPKTALSNDPTALILHNNLTSPSHITSGMLLRMKRAFVRAALALHTCGLIRVCEKTPLIPLFYAPALFWAGLGPAGKGRLPLWTPPRGRSNAATIFAARR